MQFCLDSQMNDPVGFEEWLLELMQNFWSNIVISNERASTELDMFLELLKTMLTACIHDYVSTLKYS